MFHGPSAVLPPLAGAALCLGIAQAGPLPGATLSLPAAPGDSPATHDPRGPAVGPGAGTVLTESEALRLGLADASFEALLDARAGVVQSEVLAAGLRPNPELEMERDSTGVGRSTREMSFLLSQTLDTSGRRKLLRRSAEARLEAARMEAESERVERAAEIRRRFFTVLHQQLRVAVLEDWDGRMAEAEAVVRERARAGEASGYDLSRLGHERDLASADREAALATLAQEREGLFALLAEPPPQYSRLVGALLPERPVPIEALLARLEHRPDLLALRRQEEASRLAGRAGERGRVPDVRVGVGTKRINEGDVDEWQLVLGLAVPLPLFDRGQPAVARADASSRVAAGEHRLAMREAQAALRGLLRRAEMLQASASRFETRTVAEAVRLADTAKASYQAGEIGILELLDAYRGVMQASTRSLELALEARLAAGAPARLAGETGS